MLLDPFLDWWAKNCNNKCISKTQYPLLARDLQFLESSR